MSSVSSIKTSAAIILFLQFLLYHQHYMFQLNNLTAKGTFQ